MMPNVKQEMGDEPREKRQPLMRSTRRSSIDRHLDLSREATPVATHGEIRDIIRETVREETASLHAKLDQITSYLERMERRSINDRNVMQSISNTVNEKEETGELLKKSVKALAKDVSTAVRNLPTAPIQFDYNEHGMSKARVDLFDGGNVSYPLFASRIADHLFKDQLHLPFEDRDPLRVVWLEECLSHRRKFSVGLDQQRQWKEAVKRINANHRSYMAKLVQPPAPRMQHGQDGKFISKVKQGGVSKNTPTQRYRIPQLSHHDSPHQNMVPRRAHNVTLQTPRSRPDNQAPYDMSMSPLSPLAPRMMSMSEDEYEMDPAYEQENEEWGDYEDPPIDSQYNSDTHYEYM